MNYVHYVMDYVAYGQDHMRAVYAWSTRTHVFRIPRGASRKLRAGVAAQCSTARYAQIQQLLDFRIYFVHLGPNKPAGV